MRNRSLAAISLLLGLLVPLVPVGIMLRLRPVSAGLRAVAVNDADAVVASATFKRWREEP